MHCPVRNLRERVGTKTEACEEVGVTIVDDGDDPDVRVHWGRLCVTLRDSGAQQTLEAFAPGLSAADIERALADAGELKVLVRGQVRQWFECVNGVHPGRWAPLFPGVDLLSIQQMIKTHAMMLDVAAAAPGYPREAGVPVHGFIPEFVPIADRDGYLLVADLREGDESGAIISYDKVDADDDAQTWPSLTHLLTELTVAIGARRALNGLTPHIDDGELRWR